MLYNLAEFFGDLGLAQVALDPMDRRAMSQTAGGEQIPVQIGPRLWQGTVTVNPYPHAEANVIRARIARLTEPDAAFLVSPPEITAAGASGTIAGINVDRRRVALTGLAPVEGEYIGFVQSDVYSLHWVTGTDGPTRLIVPALPLSFTTGATATTTDPLMAAVMVPNTVGPSLVPVLSESFSFSFVQTLRAVT